MKKKLGARSAFEMKTILIVVFVLAAIPTCRLHGQQIDTNAAKPKPLVQLGNIRPKKIHESSGLAFCESIKDAIWTHNDSGNANEVYLLSTAGELLLTVKLNGATNVDWESMCRVEEKNVSYLVVGDVGDNKSRRKSCQFYIFPEPRTTEKANLVIQPTKVEFCYEDGPRNCEAISYDSASKKVWLIEKRYVDDIRTGHPGVYTLPFRTTSTKQRLTAKRIGDFPVRNVTGMAFSPDGNSMIVRNYLNAHLFARKENESWAHVLSSVRPRTIAFPIQMQGEAVCFTPDSGSVILTSESTRQPIWKVNLKAQRK